MAKRKTAPQQTNSSKRRKPPTVREIKSLVEGLNDSSTADDLPKNDVAEALYHTLRRKFSAPRNNRALLRSEEAALCDAIKLEYSVPVKKVESWVKEPATFWESYSYRRENLDKQESSNQRIRSFIRSSWRLDESANGIKLLRRFNCIANCLNLMRWKGDWQLTTAVRRIFVDDFLAHYQCVPSKTERELTFSQIRSGQRQLKLLICLDKLMGNEMDVEDYQYRDYINIKSSALLFLDQMPFLNSETDLKDDDAKRVAECFLKQGFSQWSVTSKASQYASSLLGWAEDILWMDSPPINVEPAPEAITVSPSSNNGSPYIGDNPLPASHPPPGGPTPLDDFASIALDTRPCYLTQDSAYGTDVASQEATATSSRDWNVRPGFPAAEEPQEVGLCDADTGHDSRPRRTRLPSHAPQSRNDESRGPVLADDQIMGIQFESNEIDEGFSEHTQLPTRVSQRPETHELGDIGEEHGRSKRQRTIPPHSTTEFAHAYTHPMHALSTSEPNKEFSQQPSVNSGTFWCPTNWGIEGSAQLGASSMDRPYYAGRDAEPETTQNGEVFLDWSQLSIDIETCFFEEADFGVANM